MNIEILYSETSASILSIVITTACFYFLSRRRRGLLTSVTRFLNVAWSLLRHWSNFLRGLLSLSLSRSEQSIFEEEFKYLIVTSSLFNETPQQQLPRQQQQQQVDNNKFEKGENNNEENISNEEESNSSKSLSIRLLGITTLSVIFSLVIWTKFNSVSPLMIPCIIPVYITLCYFMYRHHRHVQIRRIHVSALDSMHRVISLSQRSDAIIVRLLNNFHSLNFGETITTAAEIDQQQQQQQHQEFGALLSSHFETYIELVQQLQPLIDSQNLFRLREMYNVNEEIPSTLLEFDSQQYSMEDIDLIHTVVGWKRREYLLYLIALDVMSTTRRNKHYGKTWRQAIQVNTNLVKEYSQFNKKLVAIPCNIETSDEGEKKDKAAPTTSPTSSITTTASNDVSTPSTSLSSDKRSLALMHRVSAVEKYIEDIQAKLFLCKQDTKSFSSGRVSALTLEKISKQFGNIDENISNFLTQWEESKSALNTLLEDEQSKLNTIMSLPSPPSSPRDFHHNSNDESSSGSLSHSLNTQLSRSKSYSGGYSSISNRPSFSKNRLQRIQSLKTKNRNVMEPKSLPPIKTTTTASASSKAVSE